MPQKILVFAVTGKQSLEQFFAYIKLRGLPDVSPRDKNRMRMQVSGLTTNAPCFDIVYDPTREQWRSPRNHEKAHVSLDLLAHEKIEFNDD